MPPKKETELLNLENFSVIQLPELQGKKEEIKAIIDANPIVVIIDTETYEVAKKSRTAVKTLRTGTEKEKTNVKQKLKEKILDLVDNEYTSIITDIKKEEDLRQASVTKWENEIEERRKEKQRLEQERTDTLKAILSNYSNEWKAKFNILVFSDIEKVSSEFYESYTMFDASSLNEFEPLFPKKVEELTELLNIRVKSLTETETANSKKAIGEFYVAWGSKLNFMTYQSSEETLKVFRDQKKLSFHIYEFQEEYKAKFSEIEKQLIDKQKSLLEAKLSSEKLQKEQKELAEKEQKAKDERDKFAKEKEDFELAIKKLQEKSDNQLKIDNRIDKLIDLGLKFDFQQTFAGNEFFIDVLDIKTYDDEKWTDLITKIETKINTPVEEPLQAVSNIVDVNTIEVVTDSPNESLVEKLITIIEKQNILDLKEMQTESSWESIFKEFKLSGEKSLSAWLKTNYNVPTKIN